MPSGSIRKITLNSITFNVAADANAAMTPRITKEGIPHSGGNMIKVTKATGSVEGLTVIANDTEYQQLSAIAEMLTDVSMSFQKADGSVWTSQGHINLDNYESEENRVDVMLIPSTGEWDLFAA